MYYLFEDKMDFCEESQFSSWRSNLHCMSELKICMDRSLFAACRVGSRLGEEEPVASAACFV